MQKSERTFKRLPSVPMTVGALMKRPMAEVQNYHTEVLPLLKVYDEYRQGFLEAVQQVPGTFYAVANFNLPSLEPRWCRERINLFDMKISRCLLGKNWCQQPESKRPNWIAIPERATYLHYNMIWQVPIEHQEKFFFSASRIWRDVVRSGQFDVQVVGEEPGDAVAVRAYSVKTFHPVWSIDGMITSTELRRKK